MNSGSAVVKDLHEPQPWIYRTDLAISTVTGWGAFAATLALPAGSPESIGTTLIAVAALYRALCFIHEISHQSRRSLPGFELVWNLTTGFPLLMPSFMYVGVHQYHHHLGSYGTTGDPEYLPFARSSRMTIAFALQSFLIPFALAVRFLLLAPLGLALPRVERWLVAHFSSLTMNVRYRRAATPDTISMVRRQSAAVVIYWACLISLALGGYIPRRFFALWFTVSALIGFVNTLRTLGAHAYDSPGNRLSREEQLRDSIDTPAPRWGTLWAPVGLRFHALHHYYPGIPYHNLGEAYRRLTAALPAGTGIHLVRSPGLGHSLSVLLRKGQRKAG